MKEVRKHLGDEDLHIQLVRYHNAQALEKLRELSIYIQMLLSRIENPQSKRVVSNEVDIIIHDAASTAEHLRNAEMFTRIVAQDKSEAVVAQTINETEAILTGGVQTLGLVRDKDKKADM